ARSVKGCVRRCGSMAADTRPLAAAARPRFSRHLPVNLAGRAWSAAWPPIAAATLLIGAWQVVVWLGLKPDYILPGPMPVFGTLGQALREPAFWTALATTGVRAVFGFSIALVIGLLRGLAVALPSFVGGLKQGWAFAWRSLMAGELLVIIAQRPSLGARLQFAREFADAQGLLAMMIVILVIGIVVDQLYGLADRWIRRRWGLV